MDFNEIIINSYNKVKESYPNAIYYESQGILEKVDNKFTGQVTFVSSIFQDGDKLIHCMHGVTERINSETQESEQVTLDYEISEHPDVFDSDVEITTSPKINLTNIIDKVETSVDELHGNVLFRLSKFWTSQISDAQYVFPSELAVMSIPSNMILIDSETGNRTEFE